MSNFKNRKVSIILIIFLAVYIIGGIILNIIFGGLTFRYTLIESRIRDNKNYNRNEYLSNLYDYFFDENLTVLTKSERNIHDNRFRFVPVSVKLLDETDYELQLLDHLNPNLRNVTYKFPKKLLNREKLYNDRRFDDEFPVLLTAQEYPLESNSRMLVAFTDFYYRGSWISFENNDSSRKEIYKANQQIMNALIKSGYEQSFLLVHNLRGSYAYLMDIENNDVHFVCKYNIEVPENVERVVRQNTKIKGDPLFPAYCAAFVLDTLTYPFQPALYYMIICSIGHCE